MNEIYTFGGRKSSGYDYRINPVTKLPEFHAGSDYAAPAGTPIPSAAAGTVVYLGKNEGLGNVVVVRNLTGDYSLYAHMQDGDRVNLGQKVWHGDPIGGVMFRLCPHILTIPDVLPKSSLVWKRTRHGTALLLSIVRLIHSSAHSAKPFQLPPTKILSPTVSANGALSRFQIRRLLPTTLLASTTAMEAGPRRPRALSAMPALRLRSLRPIKASDRRRTTLRFESCRGAVSIRRLHPLMRRLCRLRPRRRCLGFLAASRCGIIRCGLRSSLPITGLPPAMMSCTSAGGASWMRERALYPSSCRH